MRTVLFDIDGTLLITNRGGSSALAQAIHDVFDVAEPAVAIAFAGRTDRSILSELLQINGLPDTAANRDRLQKRYTELFPSVLRRQGGRLLPGVMTLDDVIVVGDTVADIRRGHAIGARVIAVCTGGQTRAELESESLMVVHEDLSQTAELLRILVPQR